MLEFVDPLILSFPLFLTSLSYGFFQKGSVRLMRSVVVDFIEWQLDLKQRSFFFTAESQPKMLELSTKVAEVVNSQQKEQEEQKSRTKVENKISKLVVKTSNKVSPLHPLALLPPSHLPSRPTFSRARR